MTKSRDKNRRLLDELDSLKSLLETDLAAVSMQGIGDGDVLAELPRSFTRAPAAGSEARSPEKTALTRADKKQKAASTDKQGSPVAAGGRRQARPVGSTPGEEAIPVLSQAVPASGAVESPPTRADLEALAELLIERRLAQFRDALREEVLVALARRAGLNLKPDPD